MGSSYEHLSREELLALLATQSASAATRVGESTDESAPPSSGDRYRPIVEECVGTTFEVYLPVAE